MKNTNKKFMAAVISVVLCITLIGSCVIPVSAAASLTDIFAGILGGSDSGSMNLTDAFADWINGMIQEDKDGPIDSFVENIKNQWNGVTDDTQDDPEADKEEVIVIDKGEAQTIAKLFNLTVNELKAVQPSFTKTIIASLDTEIAQQLQGGLGPVTGIVESLVGEENLFAGIINGTSNSRNELITRYPYGNDVINNIPLTGKEYVACLEGADIKDYSITIYKSGAYKMHIDLNDVEGSAAQSGLAHVFDVTDKAYATLNLGITSLNINVMFKYVNNFVECNVNRNGEITSYKTGMGITFMFQQEDGTYSTTMPYFNVDFQEKGIIYTITTEFDAIDFSVRAIGDADDSGKVTSSDARKVLRISAELDELDEEDRPYCDVNRDKKITSADAREILRASAELTTLPTTEEVLGYKTYVKEESVQQHIDDLLIILMAYQAAKDEEAQKELQDYYDNLYGEGSTNNNNSSTTKPEETTTQGELNTPSNKVEDIIGSIGDIINGNGNTGDIIGDLTGGSSGSGSSVGDIISGIIGGESSGSGSSFGDFIGGFIK